MSDLFNTIEPLPCPFCGQGAEAEYDELIEEWFVECQDDVCAVSGCFVGPFEERDEAVRRWNARAPSPTHMA